MRYESLSATFHTTNRHKLSEAIGLEAIAIIDTADILSRPGDFEHPFRPNSNFYYLTGVDEPKAVLVLAPGHPNGHLREILFIQETNKHMALWAGKSLTQAEASGRSGIRSVMWLSELDQILGRMLESFRTVYSNAETPLEPGPLDPSGRRLAELRLRLPMHTFHPAVAILGKFRAVKSPEEIAQIRRAITITGKGLGKAWAAIQSGLPEYALEAELTAEFTRQGATGSAFSAIIAAGKNATIIHYAAADTSVQTGELILFDVGAEAGYYAADISRCVPVSGEFSIRQRAVYEAVFRTQQAGIALHKPGATILGIDETMRKLLIAELVGLGELTTKQANSPEAGQHLRKYYAHISHHLGLDVHDTEGTRTPFVPGMVVTCEPGLYLQAEGIGVRLEDDILITSTGHEVLSKAIPSAPEEVEAAIRQIST